MSINLVLPFISTAIMFAFAASVFQRYWIRRADYFLFWGIGLTMFGLGSIAEAYSAVAPFHRAVFFIWYVFGAALNAAWIGQGTVFLLVRRKWVQIVTTTLLTLGSLVVMVLMLRTPLDGSQAVASEPVSIWYRDVMPPARQAPVRLTTPFFNIYGLVTLVGGALYSGFLFWRKRVLPNRVVGNVLIAIGALSIGFASTLTRLGYGQFLYLGELVAATLMFLGFRMAAAPAPAHQPVSAEASMTS